MATPTPVETLRLITVPDDVTKELQYSLENILEKIQLSRENLGYIITNLMRAAAKYKGITGHQKKSAVIILVKDAIKHTVSDHSLQSFLLDVVDYVAPNIIDILVDVSNSSKKIFKPVRKTFLSLSKCCEEPDISLKPTVD